MKSEYAETSKTININDINKHVDINPFMIPVQKQETSININPQFILPGPCLGWPSKVSDFCLTTSEILKHMGSNNQT